MLYSIWPGLWNGVMELTRKYTQVAIGLWKQMEDDTLSKKKKNLPGDRLSIDSFVPAVNPNGDLTQSTK